LGAEGDIWGRVGEVNRRMERIVLGFVGKGFVVQVRRFGWDENYGQNVV